MSLKSVSRYSVLAERNHHIQDSFMALHHLYPLPTVLFIILNYKKHNGCCC
uniref:Uncharacterized protein n=1 Tax=Amphimedon queenslandica TaxID=400682 RepID=A0A1X7SN57_AMPQE